MELIQNPRNSIDCWGSNTDFLLFTEKPRASNRIAITLASTWASSFHSASSKLSTVYVIIRYPNCLIQATTGLTILVNTLRAADRPNGRQVNSCLLFPLEPRPFPILLPDQQGKVGILRIHFYYPISFLDEISDHLNVFHFEMVLM